MPGTPGVSNFSGLSTPTTPFSPSERTLGSQTAAGSWGSLEQAISSMNIKTPEPVIEKPKPGSFAIGSSRQTSIDNFQAPVWAQTKKLENVLKQFSEQAAPKAEQPTESAPTKSTQSTSEKMDTMLNRAEKVTTSVSKQSKDIFGALSDLWKDSIGFKYISPEQKKKNEEKKAKEAVKNANKKSFYDQMQSARASMESAMAKMLSELAERLGVGGKSLAEQNALLGVKGRNFSYKGVNSAYHIKAMHDALVEQMNEQKRAETKAAAPAGKNSKATAVDNFMNRNASLSRQGQSAYSAAG